MALCTNTDVKTYAVITSNTDDTLLTTLIARAQQRIDTHCGRTFDVSADTTHYFDALADVDGALLYVAREGELATITTITNGDGTTIASTKYVLEPRNSAPKYGIRLLLSSGLYWTYTTDPENAIAVTGRWVYSTTPPADVVQACIRLTLWMYRQRDTSGDVDRPQLSQSGAYLMPPRLPVDVEQLLAPYKKKTI